MTITINNNNLGSGKLIIDGVDINKKIKSLENKLEIALGVLMLISEHASTYSHEKAIVDEALQQIETIDRSMRCIKTLKN